MRSRKQQYQEAEETEEKGSSSSAGDSNNEDINYNNEVGDSGEGPQLAKRRQLSSPSYIDPPSKRNRKVHSQLLHDGLLRGSPNPDRSRAASVPAQLERAASSRCNNQPESGKSSSLSPGR